MKTTLRPRRRPSRTETAFEAAVSVFLWAFRILLVLLVVVGSVLTLSSGKFSVETWVDLIVNGAVQGGIYALIALGYTMVYGIMKMINFAHGEIFMIGIFAGYFTAEYPRPGRLPQRQRADVDHLVPADDAHRARAPPRSWPWRWSAWPTGRCATRPGWCCSSAPSVPPSSCSTPSPACSARASTATPPSTSSRRRWRCRCCRCWA